MTVTNVKYENPEGSSVRATIDGVQYSGLHPALGLYARVQEWIDAGNVPEPFETKSERLTRLATEKRTEIDATFRAEADKIRAGYAPDEVLSWDKQISEAKAFKTDPLATTPLLDGILVERTDLTKDGLATKILTNADNYAAAMGPSLGKKQRRANALAAIDLVNDPDAETKIAAV